MTTIEAEWDTDTRDLALALDAVALCPACGRDPALCQDPDRADAWTVPPPVRCHATTAVRVAQGRMRESNNPHMDALLWSARLPNQAR